MGKIVFLCVLVLVITIAPACGGLNDDPHLPDSDTVTDLPPDSAEENQVVEREGDVEAGMTEFSGGSISFAYPDSLAGDAIFEEHDGFPNDELAPIPDFTTISFADYILSDTFISPVIYIFEAEEYRAVNDYAEQAINLLDEGLADSSVFDAAFEMPFLPLYNAAQVFHASLKLIDFNGGSGLRYLTMYAQDAVPVINEGLFYTFQGLTDDRRYYISLVMPVNNPGLPADLEVFFSSIDDDYEAFFDNYHEFLEEGLEILDQSDDETFTPALNVLDDLVMTLRVEK